MSLPPPTNILAIPEILILILTELPPVELLTTARGVCKLWQTTVDSIAILRWKTWSQYTPVPPPSIRHLYPNDCTSLCLTKSRDDHNEPCGVHPYSNVFEVNPLALDLVQRVWRRCMRLQRNEQHKESHMVTNANNATNTAESFCPSAGLLRPASYAKNIWIYAGVYRSRWGMDTRTYHYNSTTQQGNTTVDTVNINVLANTLLEGWQIKMREPKKDRSFLCLRRENVPEEEYYSLIIQVFGNQAENTSGQGVVGDTEITIKLHMKEPYAIAAVETNGNPETYKIDGSGGSRWPAYTAPEHAPTGGLTTKVSS
ncbi:hypothetical protein TWF694_005397 [Orbilia ellipsospora]|uniref:F-box domain-containing protein n=1 Tax=Orbilia ellipsospora TaxID=2528407 RepID=A0AAV9WU25_9PEZI